MSELEMPTVITAISSSETEGFIAGTLFAQGWSVVFRAIDWDSLERFIKTNQEMARGAILIFGSDLPGISKEKVDSIASKIRHTIGFSTDQQRHNDFDQLHDVPKSTTIAGPPNSVWAAKVFTMRSAPISFGLSTSSGTPVLIPGSTIVTRTSEK